MDPKIDTLFQVIIIGNGRGRPDVFVPIFCTKKMKKTCYVLTSRK